MTTPPPHPGVRFPPPFIFLGGLGLGVVLDRVRPLRLGTSGGLWIVGGGALIGLGLALIFWGMRTFLRAKTEILPNRPATMLVLGGPYRWTRNPMYVGFTILYLGATLLINSIWTILLLPLVLTTLLVAVIHREERYLSARFGGEYDDYRRRVRRWI